MDFPLFKDVVLLVDLPEEGVLAGDIGVVVERHDVPDLETGYSIEFFNMSGDTVAVAVVPESKLRRPVAADRPMVRQFHAPRFSQSASLTV
ncbi:MAG: DUF4926 domain-containing protein [Chloroflexi bacterium]|nr:DUF4926 domain-containing protein [Chloroflexota bacterium]